MCNAADAAAKTVSFASALTSLNGEIKRSRDESDTRIRIDLIIVHQFNSIQSSVQDSENLRTSPPENPREPRLVYIWYTSKWSGKMLFRWVCVSAWPITVTLLTENIYPPAGGESQEGINGYFSGIKWSPILGSAWQFSPPKSRVIVIVNGHAYSERASSHYNWCSPVVLTVYLYKALI